jgi:drug/metabolite transporter (DMT)-like permease
LSSDRRRSAAAVALPALFVLLWSTGFIAAKFGLPYAPPFKFLLLRFALVALLMTIVALTTQATWPHAGRDAAHLTVAALLVHGGYLGGVFVAISEGVAAGTSAMLVGLQPIITVAVARAWLGEGVVARQWLGLVLGIVGVYFVVRHKIDFSGDLRGFLPIAVALCAISIGTLYQKRFCSHIDLRSAAVIQFTACTIAYAPLAFFAGERPIQWTSDFLFALGWSVLVLSVGAISLLNWLLRHGTAANIARLFFLVPAVTAALAFAFFDERLDVAAMAGMVLIAVAVAIARANPRGGAGPVVDHDQRSA